MAEEGLKDFTVNWMVGGFLLFCLLTFAIIFMYNNNESGFDDGTDDIFNSTSDSLSNRLVGSSVDSGSLLNITANTNPEVSDLGSRDSVAVSFGSKDQATNYYNSGKKLISWVFSGTTGTILLGVMGGLVSLISLFYIWRLIRTGT